MSKNLKHLDRTLSKFFDKIGVPRLDQFDKDLNRQWQGVKNYKIKDTRSIEVSMAFAMGFVVVVIASSVTLMTLDIPDAAKDGLRLTTFISVVGLLGLGINTAFKKIIGDK
jgi:uncharacterized membrane protein YadS